MFDFEKSRFVDALRQLGKLQGVTGDTHGNLSSVHDYIDGRIVLIKPSGVPFNEIEPDQICTFLLENDGSYSRMGTFSFIHPFLNPSVDTEAHMKIYASNPEIKSICHTHSPYATAFAASSGHIPICLTEHADYFGHEINVLPFSSTGVWCDKLPKNEYAFLLKNHGTLVCSYKDDPQSAVKLSSALEMIAKKMFLIKSLCGSFPDGLPQSEVEIFHKRFSENYGQ